MRQNLHSLRTNVILLANCYFSDPTEQIEISIHLDYRFLSSNQPHSLKPRIPRKAHWSDFDTYLAQTRMETGIAILKTDILPLHYCRRPTTITLTEGVIFLNGLICGIHCSQSQYLYRSENEAYRYDKT